METKTSKEWMELIPEKYKLILLDPDGWDRKNYDYSFNEERITKEQFMDRLAFSTIQCLNVVELFCDEYFNNL